MVAGDVSMIGGTRKQPSRAQDLFVYTRAAPGCRFEQSLWWSNCATNGHDKPLLAHGHDDERLLGNALPVSEKRALDLCRGLSAKSRDPEGH